MSVCRAWRIARPDKLLTLGLSRILRLTDLSKLRDLLSSEPLVSNRAYMAVGR